VLGCCEEEGKGKSERKENAIEIGIGVEFERYIVILLTEELNRRRRSEFVGTPLHIAYIHTYHSTLQCARFAIKTSDYDVDHNDKHLHFLFWPYCPFIFSLFHFLTVPFMEYYWWM